MGYLDHTIDPMSGRQHANASERTISGARCGRAASRGYAVETADVISQGEEAARIWAAKRREIETRRAPLDDGTAWRDTQGKTYAQVEFSARMCVFALVGFIVTTLAVVVSLAWPAIVRALS